MKDSQSITCVVPAYNEEKTIGDVIEVLKQAKSQGIIEEIIVVSDGSADQTVQMAREAGADRVIDIKKNVGKGGAVLTGVKEANGEAILLIDADLLGLKVEHLQAIIDPYLNNEAEMVVAFFRDDKWQEILPQLSGQRIIAKSVLASMFKARKYRKSRYNFEILLNQKVRARKAQTKFVPVCGLDHVRKKEKYGFKKDFLHRIFYPFNMLYFYKKKALALGLAVLMLFSYFLFLAPSTERYTLANLTAPSAQEKILLIVAHPDDETIGAAGFMYNSLKNGAQVSVVVVTNGDANRWSATTTSKDILPAQTDFITEGEARMKESESALLLLGVPKENMYYLGFPDKGLAKLENKYKSSAETSPYTKLDKSGYLDAYRVGASYTGTNLEALLEEIIGVVQPDIIITHHPEDKNPDHVATYDFTRAATLSLEREGKINKPTIYSFLVHWKFGSFPHPFIQSQGSDLYPPKDLAGTYNWIEYPLSSEVEAIKGEAINMYKSQMSSPYLYPLLHAFIRTNELFCKME